jgi:ankyrin repeat protein
MNLINLPAELIFDIAKHLQEPELNSLIRTTRRFAQLLTPRLYDPVIQIFDPRLPANGPHRGWDFNFLHFAPLWNSEFIQNYFQNKTASNLRGLHPRGFTLLHVAAEAGNEKLVIVLLAKGLEVDVGEGVDGTPLSVAAIKGHESVVRLLLDAGANVLARDVRGRSVLAHAVVQGSANLVQLVIDAVKAVDGVIDTTGIGSCTPLHIAAEYGNVTSVRLLVDAGADVLARTEDHLSPLACASWGGHVDTCQLLIDATMAITNGDITIHGPLPLKLAVICGHEATVQMLISAGADALTDTEEVMGISPLAYAVMRGEKTMVQRIFAARPDLLLSEHLQNYLCLAAREANADAIALLLDLFYTGTTSLEISAPGGRIPGCTPLHYATQELRKSSGPSVQRVLQLLVDAGADISKQDSTGRTALHFAARTGNLKAVRSFVARSPATLFITDKAGQTALHRAVIPRGNEAVIRALLDIGIGVNARDLKGQTVLHKAAFYHCDMPTIRLLVQAGADILAKDNEGNPPMHISALRGRGFAVWARFGDGTDFHEGCDVCRVPIMIYNRVRQMIGNIRSGELI